MSLLPTEAVDGPFWVVKEMTVSNGSNSEATIKNESPFDNMSDILFDHFPSLNYSVEPKGEWEKLLELEDVQVSSQVYRRNDYVFVQPSKAYVSEITSKNDGMDISMKKFWVGLIVELKGDGKGAVFVRIYWTYWPDQLPAITHCGVTVQGRRYYHGKNELIATNHMDIIDVRTLSGVASIKFWDEREDEESRCLTSLYWRQGLDITNFRLSDLPKYCFCKMYYNPDTTMGFCPKCKRWLHSTCLIANRPRSAPQASPGLHANSEMSRPTITLISISSEAETDTGETLQIISAPEGIEARAQEHQEPTTSVAEVKRLYLKAEYKGYTWIGAAKCPKCGTTL